MSVIPANSTRPSNLAGPVPATVAIDTHGCKLNQSDSNLLARQFAEAGYRLVNSVAEADVYVLNTCTVTATADAKARQALNSASRANPSALIVATGCYSQRAAAELARMDSVSLVVPNTEKDALVSRVSAARKEAPVHCAPPQEYPGGLDENARGVTAAALPVRTFSDRVERSRAMVKIQEGCDQVCAYCIVPKVRGRERSIPPETIVEQINLHAAAGFREVVLTGTQLGTYGFDIPGASLPGLLERALRETSVPRIRVSSLQPQEITPELLDLWDDRRLCPHFHVPLQSGSDRVLKAMRRRYDTARYSAALDLIRRSVPDAGITTDLIVGFPGEGDSEFLESQAFAGAMGFSDMHIFPYSKRPGTSAAHLQGQVLTAVKRARVAEMLALASRGFREFRLRQVGTARTVLWESTRERDGGRVWSGLTDNYIRVYTDRGQDLGNTITRACLSNLEGDWMYARPWMGK